MKKAVVFLADGFEEIEALTVVDVLRRGKIVCDICSLNEINVQGAHNINVNSNKLIQKLNIDEYDALILPGGMPGATTLRDSNKIIEWVKKFNEEGKIIGAICAAPIVLGKAEIIKDRKITSYPGFEGELKQGKYCCDIVVEDDNIITSRGPATAMYFALKIVEKLQGENIKKELKKEMMLNFTEEKLG